jgi:hypothetical protein
VAKGGREREDGRRRRRGKRKRKKIIKYKKNLMWNATSGCKNLGVSVAAL